MNCVQGIGMLFIGRLISQHLGSLTGNLDLIFEDEKKSHFRHSLGRRHQVSILLYVMRDFDLGGLQQFIILQ